MPRHSLSQINGGFCGTKGLATGLRGAISRRHASGLTIARVASITRATIEIDPRRRDGESLKRLGHSPICFARDARPVMGLSKKVPFINSRALSSSSRSPSKKMPKAAGFSGIHTRIRYAWVEFWAKITLLWQEYWKPLSKPPPAATITKPPTVSDTAAAKSEQRSQFIDSPDSLATFLDTLASLPTDPPSLYIDLEGINLGRHGAISILQIHVLPQNMTYLIDVHSLGNTAFHTASASGQTLKTILESSVIPKVVFDVRNDSDALYALYDIKLAGIQDLQLMELAVRPEDKKKYFNGLSQCIERHGGLLFNEKQQWKTAKQKGKKLFAPEKGGSFEVLNVRPLADDLMMYCIQDVQLLPALRRTYVSKLSAKWARTVQEASEQRVVTSQGETYDNKGLHRALASDPWKVGKVNRRPRAWFQKKKPRGKKG